MADHVDGKDRLLSVTLEATREVEPTEAQIKDDVQPRPNVETPENRADRLRHRRRSRVSSHPGRRYVDQDAEPQHGEHAAAKVPANLLPDRCFEAAIAEDDGPPKEHQREGRHIGPVLVGGEAGAKYE